MHLRQVIALWDYDAQGDQELTLKEGDIISVLAKEDNIWWCGQCKGMLGMFPSGYVKPYSEFEGNGHYNLPRVYKSL